MTIADLTYDQTTPDAPGLVLAVSVTATSQPLGTLRAGMVGRPNKQVLRWQAFNTSGVVCGPIWPTRDDAAIDLLPDEEAKAQARKSAV